MATKVVMEALSPTMEEGRLVEWKKNEGDQVAVGDVIAEVETDKAVMELVARAEGTLLKQSVSAGATVPVSQVVAIIGKPGEDLSEAASSAKAPAAKRPASASVTPEAAPAAPAGQPTQIGSDDRVKASPLARRIAAERGMDLSSVEGSGPQGRIVLRDLDRATASQARPSAATTGVLPGRAPSAEPYQDVPLTQIRKTIAKRLVQSIGPVPTFYLTTEVEMERVWEAREAMLATERRNDGTTEPVRVSFNDIIVKATATALRQHRACNAWWQDDHIRYWNDVHIGMAVAIDEGLITPVIRYADQKSLREISAESHDLAGRARQRRLKPEEYTGSTFSISNLGMFEIDEFTAVINPPEAGILAVGRIAQRPVVIDNAIQTRRRMRITMSCDHRVIDGATGAQFLKTLKTILENPLALVW